MNLRIYNKQADDSYFEVKCEIHQGANIMKQGDARTKWSGSDCDEVEMWLV